MSKNKHLYRLRNKFEGETVEWALNDILREINPDRNVGWLGYDESDWLEGFEVFAEWELIASEQCKSNLNPVETVDGRPSQV